MKMIKSGDTVTIISGSHKGEQGKVVKIDKSAHKAMIENINIRTRHLKKTMWNPTGGKKDIHVGIDLSNLKLIATGEKKATKKATKATKAKKETK